MSELYKVVLIADCNLVFAGKGTPASAAKGLEKDVAERDAEDRNIRSKQAGYAARYEVLPMGV